MPLIGFHCSHEQLPPSQLLAAVRRAEQAGFAAAMCSDHFHPWSERQGQSGFAWSWLGAALESTRLSFGTVCAPGQRYHPAVIAQAAATLAEMYPDRFWVALGSGEALNESITGERWPEKRQRNARLKEAVDIIRALWAGETVNHDGLIRVREARLYTRPKRPPLVIGPALTPETARWLGGWADGLITVAAPRDDLRKLVDAFRAGGGEGKPIYLQVALAFAPTDDEAIAVAHTQWRQAALDSRTLADTPTPQAFDAAAFAIGPAEVAARLRVSSDLSRHRDWLLEDAELGFETIYLHDVSRQWSRFIDQFAAAVLPAFGAADSSLARPAADAPMAC
jgi:probable non-F420 flavinoid oxidoreductase